MTRPPSAEAALEQARAAARRERMVGLVRGILSPLLLAALVLGAWEWVVAARNIPAVILPAPSAVAAALVALWPLLMQHAWPTGSEAVAAFVLASLGGVALAVAISGSAWVRAAVYPNMVFFQLIPKIALAPLFLVWLGIGTEMRLTFAVFIAFFPVVISTLTGLAAAPADMLRLCRGLEATPAQVFWHVRLPYALPSIFAGLKIAITFSIIGVVVGEFITAQAGLGYLILFASSTAETRLILAAICVLCAVGLGLFAAVAVAEKLVLRRFGQGVVK
ncbi:ABC transporter permease [Roseococcus sp. DSY-14]|uniref:ABC transporter permease n=1 Tax=Roseococcus sp. DSY-14 TaxID=3369650 RepID=UPI00387B9CE8